MNKVFLIQNNKKRFLAFMLNNGFRLNTDYSNNIDSGNEGHLYNFLE